MLQRPAEFRRAGEDLAATDEVVCHADIEKIELGGGDRLSFSRLLKRREEMGHKGVFENLIVLPNRSRRNAGIISHLRKVDDLAVRQSGDVEKSGEIFNGACESFRTDL